MIGFEFFLVSRSSFYGRETVLWVVLAVLFSNCYSCFRLVTVQLYIKKHMGEQMFILRVLRCVSLLFLLDYFFFQCFPGVVGSILGLYNGPLYKTQGYKTLTNFYDGNAEDMFYSRRAT